MTTKIRPANPWALPDAQLVLPVGADRDTWLTERRKGLGSSDAPVLMGHPQGEDSEYRLWLDKTGRLEHQDPTHAMQRGIWLESHLVEWFTARAGVVVRRCGLVANRDNDTLRATPDRLTDDGGVLEVKTMGPWAATTAEWRQGVAAHAWLQGQWQLMVTGRTRLWFCAYAVDTEPMIRGPFEPDDALIERMRNRARFWWDTYVAADQAPPVDLATITDDEIELRWPKALDGVRVETEYPAYLREILAERAALKTTIKTAQDRADEIDRGLRAMAQDAEAISVNGIPVVTFRNALNPAKVDPKLETEHPTIWSKYIHRGTHRRINVTRAWRKAWPELET
jgi:putative phage-type endonuclease